MIDRPRMCVQSLVRQRGKAQAGSVAKLIQHFDNSPGRRSQALPASRGITYHKVQFGKVAFADPRQPCLMARLVKGKNK